MRRTKIWWWVLLLAAAWGMDSGRAAETRAVWSLDRGWRFFLGDIPFPSIRGHSASYANAKAGQAWGAAAPEYDDTHWRQVDLPHDWAVEGPFDPTENLAQGYRRRGIGWYRRHFRLDEAVRGRHLELQFDGVATYCTIWFNGTLVHRNWCGYTSSAIDITSLAQYGDEMNTIAVRVDADAMEGWWYEGAGIYRHTWLVQRAPVHVVTDGVFAQPVRDARGAWSVPVEVTVENSGAEEARATIAVSVIAPAGQVVAMGQAELTVPILGTALALVRIPVAHPTLWTLDAPTLYQVKTEVRTPAGVVDAVTTACGFRTIRFDPDRGFFLNDQPVKLQGTCNHQDHAGVGVAVPDALWAYRLRRLKEMGANAYRCAHNPPAAEFLDACDRLGMLVMDENRVFNPAPEQVRQLEWMVRRDRNHPSVILWSVFNEEPMQGTAQGLEMVRRLKAVVRRLDATRPVTAAQNGGLLTPLNVSRAVDVVGFNYQIQEYDAYHAAHPDTPLLSSEDTSGLMTRGEYTSDRARHVLGAYDTEAPPWGTTHRLAWQAIAERPFLAGGFVWTGFDYRGEPTPFAWPTVSSSFGCMDTCGFPKTAYYIHQAHWIKDRPILMLVPHWNWAGREGQPIRVLALSNAEAVELFLNDRSLGNKRVDPYAMVDWMVPYAPGRLTAVARQAGREVARYRVETTGAPVALHLQPDRPALRGDGQDALPITVSALDAAGRAVPTADLPLELTVEGPALLLGHGNGDPNSHADEKGPQRRLFHGLAQLIVQSRRGGTGEAVITVRSGTLRASLPLRVVAAEAPLSVPPTAPVFVVKGWRLSRITPTRPAANGAWADSDQNSWQPIAPGPLPAFPPGGGYAVYRAKFKPVAAVQARGGALRFRSITGRAEIWLDGQRVARKDAAEAQPLLVAVPAGAEEHVVAVVFESTGAAAGLGGSVMVQTQD